MDEPMKAAVFVCRAHGVNLMAMRQLLKDPRVGHSEILPSCCSPAGMDQVQLHLRGGTAQALLVVGCPRGSEERYREMAKAAGLPWYRVAVVPSEACRTVNAAELALARVLDVRQPVLPAERRSSVLLIVGHGSSAEAALEQAEAGNVAVHHITVDELLEPGARVLGGPGRFVLEAGESIYEFGEALLVLDQEVCVVRDVLADEGATVIVLSGGEECLEHLMGEAEKALSKGEVIIIAQEMPFIGVHELEYRGLQSRGVRFVRAAEVKVTGNLVTVMDEHLGKDLQLSAAELITISSHRPERADQVLTCFGLPKGWRTSDAVTGESGISGVYLGGSALTAISSCAERDVRALVVKLANTGVQRSGLLASVDRERCSLCLTCLRICPYGAPYVDGERMSISAERCRGCGICLSTCPGRAIEMPFADLRAEDGRTMMVTGGRSA